MLDRKALEKVEARNLAAYAALSQKTRGRVHNEAAPETRTEFQRDRDRVVHSKAFRRLKHKTQVFVATGEGDHYRTRLTHTLEVAQIARNMARALQLNEDLTETIALAHDLGHTPFGHAGEKVLDQVMAEYGGFEHNRQSKRVVELIEKKYVAFPGLNLTYEVLDGLMKHRTPYDNAGAEMLQGPSLEAQVVNAADQIAYNSHDIDDGLDSGFLTWTQLNKNSLWSAMTEHHRKLYPRATKQELQGLNIRRLINVQVMDVLQETERRLKINKIKTYADVLRCQTSLVDYSEHLFPAVSSLRVLLYEKLYAHKRILSRNQQAEEVITTIFKHCLKYPRLAYAASTYVKDTPRAIVVCDFIAGMSDQYALNMYSFLAGKTIPRSTTN